MLVGIYDDYTRIGPDRRSGSGDRSVREFLKRCHPLIRPPVRPDPHITLCRAGTPERLLIAAALLLTACIPDDRPPALFELLDPKSTGVAFVNRLPETPELNILNH